MQTLQHAVHAVQKEGQGCDRYAIGYRVSLSFQSNDRAKAIDAQISETGLMLAVTPEAISSFNFIVLLLFL